MLNSCALALARLVGPVGLIAVMLFSSDAYSQEEEDGESPRWRVKTLSDRDTLLVRFDSIIHSTIHEQNAFPAAEVSGDVRRLACETAVYEITGILIALKRELDGDYHLVMRDPEIPTAQMVFELPNPDRPEVRATSRWRQYATIRKTIDSLTSDNQQLLFERRLEVPIKLKFTGVGFHDSKHLIPQAGMAKNRRELHPVLSVDVVKD